MLTIEIRDDGGVLISGTEADLYSLSVWLRRAVRRGFAEPALVTDEALTSIEIVVDDGPEVSDP